MSPKNDVAGSLGFSFHGVRALKSLLNCQWGDHTPSLSPQPKEDARDNCHWKCLSNPRLRAVPPNSLTRLDFSQMAVCLDQTVGMKLFIIPLKIAFLRRSKKTEIKQAMHKLDGCGVHTLGKEWQSPRACEMVWEKGSWHATFPTSAPGINVGWALH